MRYGQLTGMELAPVPKRSTNPAALRDRDPKLAMKREVCKSPRACCRKPVTSGPNAMPTELIIMVTVIATANSRGRIPGRWNGTVNRIGQKPQAIPFRKENKNSSGIEGVRVIPTYVPAMRRPKARSIAFSCPVFIAR